MNGRSLLAGMLAELGGLLPGAGRAGFPGGLFDELPELLFDELFLVLFGLFVASFDGLPD